MSIPNMTNRDKVVSLSFELQGAARMLRRNFDRRAREHGLSRSRWQVLWVLSQSEGQKQAELAEETREVALDITLISAGMLSE